MSIHGELRFYTWNGIGQYFRINEETGNYSTVPEDDLNSIFACRVYLQTHGSEFNVPDGLAAKRMIQVWVRTDAGFAGDIPTPPGFKLL